MPKPKSLDPVVHGRCAGSLRFSWDPRASEPSTLQPGTFRPSLKQPALHHATAANRTRTGSKCEHDLSTWLESWATPKFLYCLPTQMWMISTSLSLQQKLAEMSWSCGRDTESMKPSHFFFVNCQLCFGLFWYVEVCHGLQCVQIAPVFLFLLCWLQSMQLDLEFANWQSFNARIPNFYPLQACEKCDRDGLDGVSVGWPGESVQGYWAPQQRVIREKKKTVRLGSKKRCFLLLF